MIFYSIEHCAHLSTSEGDGKGVCVSLLGTGPKDLEAMGLGYRNWDPDVENQREIILF